MKHFLRGVLLAGILIADAAHAVPRCRLTEVASIPARFEQNQIQLTLQVNGTPVQFILDTGASVSSISRRLAERLGLPIKQFTQDSFAGVGGTFDGAHASIAELKMGAMVGYKVDVLVTPAGGDGTTDEWAGLLGSEFLSQYDVEIDPQGHRVALFQQGCAGSPVYWYDDYFEMPLRENTGRQIKTDVIIDGKSFGALIDTGASRSTMNLRTAREQLNVDIGTEDHYRSVGVDERKRLVAGHVFKQLVFGPVTLPNIPFQLMSFGKYEAETDSHLRESPLDGTPVLIGMDVLAKFHSFISYSRHKIDFTLANERTITLPTP